MWTLAKSLIGLLVVAALAWFVFFVDLGGSTLSGHAQEVWSSEVVQEKVTLLKDGVTDELEDRLAEAAEKKAGAATRDALQRAKHERAKHEITEEDRESLNDLIAEGTTGD